MQNKHPVHLISRNIEKEGFFLCKGIVFVGKNAPISAKGPPVCH